MLIFPGGSAASAFRLQKRLLSIRERVPSAADLSAYFLYLVDLEGELPVGHRHVLENLLGSAPAPGVEDISEDTLKYTAFPRFGTVSPWSTKATDIIHRCGLGQVRRVERGIVWQVDVTSACSEQEIAGFLHDPMTESVIANNADLVQIFQQADAARQEAKRRALTLTKWELGVVVVLAVLLPMRYFEDSSPMVHMIYGHFNLMTENLGDWLLDLFGLRSLVEGW